MTPLTMECQLLCDCAAVCEIADGNPQFVSGALELLVCWP